MLKKVSLFIVVFGLYFLIRPLICELLFAVVSHKREIVAACSSSAVSTVHPAGYKIALVLTVIFDLLDLFKWGCSSVLPLSCVFVDSDSDDSDDFALALKSKVPF